MGFATVSEMMLSLYPKRNIKSKKKRIRKKYANREYWHNYKLEHWNESNEK